MLWGAEVELLQPSGIQFPVMEKVLTTVDVEDTDNANGKHKRECAC